MGSAPVSRASSPVPASPVSPPAAVTRSPYPDTAAPPARVGAKTQPCHSLLPCTTGLISHALSFGTIYLSSSWPVPAPQTCSPDQSSQLQLAPPTHLPLHPLPTEFLIPSLSGGPGTPHLLQAGHSTVSYSLQSQILPSKPDCFFLSPEQSHPCSLCSPRAQAVCALHIYTCVCSRSVLCICMSICVCTRF